MHQGNPRSKSRNPLRIGILGAASVVNRTWPALHRAGHIVTYIGCRDTSRAEALVKDVTDKVNAQATTASARLTTAPRIGSYEDVVGSSDVDVVYIPLPASCRHEWVLNCIQHGKHVVGEKPAAVSLADLRKWMELMCGKRLLYMDGTLLSHSKRIQAVQNRLNDLGTLRHIVAVCNFPGSDLFFEKDIRANPRLEPLGALGDTGWCCIRWILHLVGFTVPAKVSGRVISCTERHGDGNGGAISGFEGHLMFPSEGSSEGKGAITASFHCDFMSPWEQTVTIFGTHGCLTVNSAMDPSGDDLSHIYVERNVWGEFPLASARLECTKETVPVPSGEEEYNFQAEQLWRDVETSLMRLGRGEPLLADPEKTKKWFTQAYVTQLVLDKVLEAARLNTVVPTPVDDPAPTADGQLS